MAKVFDTGAGPRALIEQGIEETVRFFGERPSYLRMHLQDRMAWGLDGQSTEDVARELKLLFRRAFVYDTATSA